MPPKSPLHLSQSSFQTRPDLGLGISFLRVQATSVDILSLRNGTLVVIRKQCLKVLRVTSKELEAARKGL